MYADYIFYTKDFFGALIEEWDFPRLSSRASAFLDYYTQGRAAKYSNLHALKMACCAVAEKYQQIEQAQALFKKAAASETAASETGELQSQSVGDWSKTYRSRWDSVKSARESADSAQSSLADAAKLYLSGTSLLYRGGRCGCVSSHCDDL